MKTKLWPVVFLSLAVAIALVLCEVIGHSGSFAPNPTDNIQFCINGKETVGCWQQDGKHYYAFLPSYIELDQTTVVLPNGQDVMWGGIPLVQGMNCSTLEVAKEHEVVIGGNAAGTLTIVQSANVATMYVEAPIGELNVVHKNKENSAHVGIRLYTAQGDLNYQGSGDDQIRGHGNSTWKYDKKSYNLYLAEDHDILDMGSGSKWVLLANAVDATNLRNKVVFDFASEVGAYGGFAPHASFVDVYLNGEYHGLYLIADAVTTAASRNGLNKDGTLFHTELSQRVQDAAAFSINPGISVEVDSPKDLPESQRTALQDDIVKLQEALLTGTADDGRGWKDYVDVDSWARKYLIEEAFMNYDAGAASQYYIWDTSRSVFFAGPCWDYDNTLGLRLHTDPNCFLASREWKNSKVYTPWFKGLMDKPSFKGYVMELYKNTFLPAFQELVDETLPNEEAKISQPSSLNAIRWGLDDAHGATEQIRTFLKGRLAFLSSAWIDGTKYRTITLKGNGDYRYFCVRENEPCTKLPPPAAFEYDEDALWYLENSNEPFDRNTVLSKDITLYARVPDAKDLTTALRRIPKQAFISAFIAMLFVALVVVDVRRRGDGA